MLSSQPEPPAAGVALSENGLSISEQPVLAVREYGVAFHFITVTPPGSLVRPASQEFSSFERDLLSYAYRGNPPFASHVLAIPTNLQRVQVSFPSALTYVSEGSTMRLVCADTDRDGVRVRDNLLKASRTDFKSGLSIYHLVLAPEPGSAQSAYNEYDFVKLAKLWEGGEGVDPESPLRIDRVITFRVADQRPFTLTELATIVLGISPRESRPRLGTIQILTRGTRIQNQLEWSNVWEHIQALKGTTTALPPSASNSLPERELAVRAAKSVAGILQGLLDFDRIEPTELSDVFDSVKLVSDMCLGIHKGTLIAISDESRPFDVASTVGISPYLLAPQAILAHNEELLRRAAIASEDAAKAKLRVLAQSRREMQQALDRHLLPNLLHYPTERMLFTLGETSRGLDEWERMLRAAMADIKAEVDSRVADRRRVAEDVIAGLLLIVSGASLRGMVPLTVVFPALSIAALLYVLWRMRT